MTTVRYVYTTKVRYEAQYSNGSVTMRPVYVTEVHAEVSVERPKEASK